MKQVKMIGGPFDGETREFLVLCPTCTIEGYLKNPNHKDWLTLGVDEDGRPTVGETKAVYHKPGDNLIEVRGEFLWHLYVLVDGAYKFQHTECQFDW